MQYWLSIVTHDRTTSAVNSLEWDVWSGSNTVFIRAAAELKDQERRLVTPGAMICLLMNSNHKERGKESGGWLDQCCAHTKTVAKGPSTHGKEACCGEACLCS